MSHWSEDIYQMFRTHHISMVSYVPDAGHIRLINACNADSNMVSVSLTTEEEGVAFAAGAHLGGKRAVLLMQSSGVGNCVNMLSLIKTCAFPFVTIITMRGEWGEFNPWQVAMGQSTPTVLSAMGVLIYRVDRAEDVAGAVDAAIKMAFGSSSGVAVLLSQRLIGIKSFTEAK